jgi:hypothetical protein
VSEGVMTAPAWHRQPSTVQSTRNDPKNLYEKQSMPWVVTQIKNGSDLNHNSGHPAPVKMILRE